MYLMLHLVRRAMVSIVGASIACPIDPRGAEWVSGTIGTAVGRGELVRSCGCAWRACNCTALPMCRTLFWAGGFVDGVGTVDEAGEVWCGLCCAGDLRVEVRGGWECNDGNRGVTVRRGVDPAVLFGGVRVSKVWVALGVSAAEAVMLACVVGLRVWELLGGAGLTQ
jgi:hypothetical protein